MRVPRKAWIPEEAIIPVFVGMCLIALVFVAIGGIIAKAFGWL